MAIYTIEVDDRPVGTLSIGNLPPLPDRFATKPEILESLRSMREREEQPGVSETMDRMAISEALDTWLGSDLMTLENGGRPLWNGDMDSLHVREASPEEAAAFVAARSEAVRTGEQDAGDEDWVTFLVPVSDPTDDDEEDDDE